MPNRNHPIRGRWSRPACVALVCAVLAVLGACGQKGDLYLPDERAEVIVPQPNRA